MRRQRRVRRLAQQVRAKLKSAGHDIPDGDSPIIPIIYGTEERAVDAAEKLRKKSILAIAIRPPYGLMKGSSPDRERGEPFVPSERGGEEAMAPSVPNHCHRTSSLDNICLGKYIARVP